MSDEIQAPDNVNQGGIRELKERFFFAGTLTFLPRERANHKFEQLFLPRFRLSSPLTTGGEAQFADMDSHSDLLQTHHTMLRIHALLESP